MQNSFSMFPTETWRFAFADHEPPKLDGSNDDPLSDVWTSLLPERLLCGDQNESQENDPDDPSEHSPRQCSASAMENSKSLRTLSTNAACRIASSSSTDPLLHSQTNSLDEFVSSSSLDPYISRSRESDAHAPEVAAAPWAWRPAHAMRQQLGPNNRSGPNFCNQSHVSLLKYMLDQARTLSFASILEQVHYMESFSMISPGTSSRTAVLMPLLCYSCSFYADEIFRCISTNPHLFVVHCTPTGSVTVSSVEALNRLSCEHSMRAHSSSGTTDNQQQTHKTMLVHDSFMSSNCQPATGKPTKPSNYPTESCEEQIVRKAHQLLCTHWQINASPHCSNADEDVCASTLKVVELANTIRGELGTQIFKRIRERYGGLLTLLELHQNLFIVKRIPKSDTISLSYTEIANLRRLKPPSTLIDPQLMQSWTMRSEEFPKLHSQKIQNAHEICTQQLPKHVVSSNSHHVVLSEPFGGASARGHSQPPKCLHLGNVPVDATEKSIYNDFVEFGPVEFVKIVENFRPQKSDKDKSMVRPRRIGFVRFQHANHAARAKVVMGRKPMWRSNISFARKDVNVSRNDTNHSLGYKR